MTHADCDKCTHQRFVEHCNPNLEDCVCACPSQWVEYNGYPPSKVTILTTAEAKATGLCRFEKKKRWF